MRDKHFDRVLLPFMQRTKRMVGLLGCGRMNVYWNGNRWEVHFPIYAGQYTVYSFESYHELFCYCLGIKSAIELAWFSEGTLLEKTLGL